MLPTITERNIRTFVGEQNFLKGQQHVRDGAIINPQQQAMTLKAYCYGSLPEPYHVQVTLDSTGITSFLCSCSAGTPTYGNRRCDHVAALLLAWNEQPEAFTFLEEKHITPVLVEVALDEGNIERMLQLLEATKPHGLENYQWKYDYALAPAVAVKVAERAEEMYPRASLDLYQQYVEHLINGHGRANYQDACTYLVKMRSLYQQMDETEQWTSYIAWIRKRHSRLRTLKQELTAAGL